MGKVLISLINNKAPGPSGLTGELMRNAGNVEIEDMTSVMNGILFKGEVPEE